MPPPARSIATLGAILVVLGAVGFAGGTYLLWTDECRSGTELHVSTVSSDADDRTEGLRAFDELTPVEQRVFLEAYTDDHDSTDVYENWSRSWFDDVRFVAYRGERYEVTVAVVDCGAPGRELRNRGVHGALAGLAALGLASARRRLR